VFGMYMSCRLALVAEEVWRGVHRSALKACSFQCVPSYPKPAVMTRAACHAAQMARGPTSGYLL